MEFELDWRNRCDDQISGVLYLCIAYVYIILCIILVLFRHYLLTDAFAVAGNKLFLVSQFVEKITSVNNNEVAEVL